MTSAQVAVADYRPDWWPAATRLLIRRVRLGVCAEPGAGHVSADPRARRRRTLHPDQRVLPITELAAADAVYGYSFVVTNLDASTGERAAAVEHWYRHRTSIENIFRDAKLGAGLRHLPSGYPEVNTAWMWGALLAASIAGWLHQLTATRSGARLSGHGVRGGQAMIATLRHRLIRVPARLVHHAGALTLRLPPGHHLLDEVLARIRALPALTRPSRPRHHRNPAPEATLGLSACANPEITRKTISTSIQRSTRRLLADSGQSRFWPGGNCSLSTSPLAVM